MLPAVHSRARVLQLRRTLDEEFDRLFAARRSRGSRPAAGEDRADDHGHDCDRIGLRVFPGRLTGTATGRLGPRAAEAVAATLCDPAVLELAQVL